MATTTAAAAPAAAAPAAQATTAAPAAAGAAPAAVAGQATPAASLYCGNLASDVTEGALFELFNGVGPVASIRVCRDVVTRRSLGYAYVNFHNASDADRALNALNYHTIHGRDIRLMWSQRDPGLRRSGVGNIFIKNLDPEIDNKSLHDTFTTFGNILSCRVMLDENGQSRGFGFVHFETAEAANSAISKLNGMLLNGKQVFVGLHVSKRERASKFEEMKKNFTNIYVKFIDPSVSDEELLALFREHGEITSYMIARDANGASKGFGFINFTNHEEAMRACEALNNHELAGKKLYVSRAQKKSERVAELTRRRMERFSKYQDTNLYVKNIDDSILDDKLRQEFSSFGTITSAKVTVDDKGVSRGFGFVCFAEPDEATKAIAAMNGKMVGNKPLYVALAMRKEYRRQYLENQYQQRMMLAQQHAMQSFGYYQPGMPARGQFMYPPAMMQQRPRFPPQGGAGAAGIPAAGPGNRQGFMQGPLMSNARPPRQGRTQPPRAYAGPMNGMPMGARPPMGGPNGKMRPMDELPNPNATLEELAKLDAAGKSARLGNYIYSQVLNHLRCDAETASRITGIALTFSDAVLVEIQNSPQALRSHIEEIMRTPIEG